MACLYPLRGHIKKIYPWMNYHQLDYSKRAQELAPNDFDLLISNPTTKRFAEIDEPFIRKIVVNTSTASVPLDKRSPQYLNMFNPANKFGYDFYAPCGRCVGCQMRKRMIISTKFDNALKAFPNAYFLTITFSNEKVTRLTSYKNNGNSSFNTMLSKYDVKRILSNIRNKLRRAYGLEKNPKIHYILCGEYGPKTLRAHYHIALFLPFELPNLKSKGNDKLSCSIFNSKQYGFYDLERIKQGSNVSQYITKYMTKSFESMSVDLARKGKPIAKLSLKAEQDILRFDKEDYLNEGLTFQAPFILKSRRFGLNDDLRRDIDQGILSYYHKRRYIFEAGKIKDKSLYNYYHAKLIERWNKRFGNYDKPLPSKLLVLSPTHSDPF